MRIYTQNPKIDGDFFVRYCKDFSELNVGLTLVWQEANFLLQSIVGNISQTLQGKERVDM